MGTVITKPQLEGNKDCDCVLEVLNEQLAEERSKQARQNKDMHGANWHTVPDEDISLPGPSSPAPAVPPQVMHTPNTIERQGPESSHVAPDQRWTEHTLQEAQRAACVQTARPDTPRAGSWIKLWRQASPGSEEPTCCAAECSAAGKSGSHLWLYDAAQKRYDFQHCYIAPLCKMHSISNRFKHPEGNFMLKPNVTLICVAPHPTQVPGRRTDRLDYSVAESKIAVAGKLAEAPWTTLRTKPVPVRLVTAFRPSIIRTGKGPWSAATLDYKDVFLKESRQAANVNGSEGDTATTTWIVLWRKLCGGGRYDQECFAEGCKSPGKLGGHLWLFDSDKGQFDHEHCYIAPLCGVHNGRKYDFPKRGFFLERHRRVLKIVPHECYDDFYDGASPRKLRFA